MNKNLRLVLAVFILIALFALTMVCAQAIVFFIWVAGIVRCVSQEKVWLKKYFNSF